MRLLRMTALHYAMLSYAITHSLTHSLNGDIRRNHMKIVNFPTPVYLTPPMKGFPVEFGIDVRGPKCLNDGPSYQMVRKVFR